MITSPRTWAAIALALLPLSAALAEDASVADLQKRLEEQEQRTRVLERTLEIQDENAQAALPGTPIVKAGPKGFSISSQDAANFIKLRGLVQIDGRYLIDAAGLGGSDTGRPRVCGRLSRARSMASSISGSRPTLARAGQ